jgi:hypothetical protein
VSKIEWAVIYSDRSVYTNLDGSWEEAPAWGVQAVVFKSKETGWSIVEYGDYYARLENGEFIPMDRDGLVDYSANVWKRIKVGRQLSRQEFNEVYAVARGLMGHLAKTAHFKRERRGGD